MAIGTTPTSDPPQKRLCQPQVLSDDMYGITLESLAGYPTPASESVILDVVHISLLPQTL